MKLLSPGDAYTAGLEDGYGNQQLLVVECLVECDDRFGKPDALYRCRRLATTGQDGNTYQVVKIVERMWGSSITNRLGTGGVRIGQFCDPYQDFTAANLIRG